jgi:hypothetical protein
MSVRGIDFAAYFSLLKAPTLPLPLSLSIVTKRDFEDKYVSSKNYQQFLCNKSSFNYKEKDN